MQNLDKKLPPSNEQVKEFWEWCGLVHINNPIQEASNSCEAIAMDKPMNGWYYPDYPNATSKLVSLKETPLIDLNNLFKYAEFKAVIELGMSRKISIDEARKWLFERWLENIEKGMNYANALFWAIRRTYEN